MKISVLGFAALFVGVVCAEDPQTWSWIDGVAGNWSDAANWAEGGVPANGDALSFGATTGAVDDLTGLTSIASLAKTGAGAVTLANLPSSLAIGKLTMAGGTLNLQWQDNTPPETAIPASTALIGTLDLGGASLTDSASIAASSGAVTLKNGTYQMKASFPDSAWNCTVAEGATLNVTGTIYAGQPAKQWKYLTVKDGGVINFTGTEKSVLGTWYNTRWINVSLSNGSLFCHTNGQVWAGCSGWGQVTCDNSTFTVGNQEMYCTRISDNLTKDGKNYNGTTKFTFTNGSVFRAGKIHYGYAEKTDGTFTLSLQSGSTLYVGSIVGEGVTSANITFDSSTVVPTAAGVLFQDYASDTATRMHVTAGGLTIDNQNQLPLQFDARMDGAGTLTVKAHGSTVEINKPITCAQLVLDQPMSVALADDVLPAGKTVQLCFNEPATPGKVVTWTTRPANVSFALTGTHAGEYELTEEDDGIELKEKDAVAAAVAIWTGSAGDANLATTANWLLQDAAGATLTRGYINGDTVCQIPDGAVATFDTTLPFICGAFIIQGTVTLDADHNWSQLSVPLTIDSGATLDLSGHALTVVCVEGQSNALSTIGGTGSLVFNVPANETQTLAAVAVQGPVVLNKAGAGKLVATDLGGQPVLKQDAGEVALAWTGEPPTNPFATTPVNPVKGTLSLGGANQTFAAGIKTILQNGTVLLDGVYTTSNARWDWPSANEIYTIGAGAEVHSAGEWYHMNKQCPEFHVKDGGIFSYESTTLCKLGYRYNTRNGKIFLENGGVWRMDKANLAVGVSGNGYLYVRSGSLFDAPARSIYLDAYYCASGSTPDSGYGYMEVTGGSRVNVKKLLFGQTGYDHGKAALLAKEDSLFCLEYMGPDGTATLKSGLSVTFEGATVVPMIETSLAAPLLSDGQDYADAKYHVNGNGLCISNANEVAVCVDARMDGTGPFTIKAFRQDVTIAASNACASVVFQDARTVTLANEAQFVGENAEVTLVYSTGRPVKYGQVMSWSPTNPPVNVMFALDEVTARKVLLEVRPNGVFLASGLTVFLR